MTEDKTKYENAKVELYSLIEQTNKINFFVDRSMKKFSIDKDDWLEQWLIKKIIKMIKEESEIADKFLQILLRNGFDHISGTIIEEVSTKYIQERLYNKPLSYEQDEYGY
jgi:hypothetical protein